MLILQCAQWLHREAVQSAWFYQTYLSPRNLIMNLYFTMFLNFEIGCTLDAQILIYFFLKKLGIG
ncbi:hypothetical protein EMIT0P176_420026 [Pseudomonas sp. IT-P176]